MTKMFLTIDESDSEDEVMYFSAQDMNSPEVDFPDTNALEAKTLDNH